MQYQVPCLYRLETCRQPGEYYQVTDIPLFDCRAELRISLPIQSRSFPNPKSPFPNKYCCQRLSKVENSCICFISPSAPFAVESQYADNYLLRSFVAPVRIAYYFQQYSRKRQKRKIRKRKAGTITIGRG